MSNYYLMSDTDFQEKYATIQIEAAKNNIKYTASEFENLILKSGVIKGLDTLILHDDIEDTNIKLMNKVAIKVYQESEGTRQKSWDTFQAELETALLRYDRFMRSKSWPKLEGIDE